MTLKFGTPIWKKPAQLVGGKWTQTRPVLPADVTADHSEFVGATVRDGEVVGSGQELKVQRVGDILVRVLGPAKSGDIVGQMAGMDYVSPASTTQPIGTVLTPVATATVQVARVRTSSATAIATGYPFQIQKYSETQVRVVTTSALWAGLDCLNMVPIVGLGQPFVVSNGKKIYLEVLFDRIGNVILASIGCSSGWYSGQANGFPRTVRAVDNTALGNEGTLLNTEFANHVGVSTTDNNKNKTTVSAALQAFNLSQGRYIHFASYALIGFCTTGSGAAGLSLAGVNSPFAVVQCLNTHMQLLGVCDNGVPSQALMPAPAPFIDTLPTPVISSQISVDGVGQTIAIDVPNHSSATIFYSVDNQTYVQYSGKFTNKDKGAHTITAYATLTGYFASATALFSFNVA